MDRSQAAGLGLMVPQNAFVRDERTVLNWIETIFARGVRPHGYAAANQTDQTGIVVNAEGRTPGRDGRLFGQVTSFRAIPTRWPNTNG